MASRPPEHRPPERAVSDELARNRWMVINMQRVLGLGMVLLALLILQDAVDMSDLAAYVFLAVGLIDIFVVPQILARMWRSPRE